MSVSLFMTTVTFEAGRRLATSMKINLSELERTKYLRKAGFLAAGRACKSNLTSDLLQEKQKGHL